MHTDPIADYLTRIRNAIRAGHDEVEIPFSNLKIELSRILKEQGYIKDFSRKPAAVGESVVVELKYTEERQPVIFGIERVSRPGRRRYVDHENIPRVQGGTGTAIVSTSSGVMTGHEARAKGVGGEIVAYVW
jgi:small subunit ribosomal protein S8